MADKKVPGIKVILGSTKGKLVRFSYLHVHEAQLNTESNKMEFSVAALIPKTNVEDVKAVNAAIEKLKFDMWTSEKDAKGNAKNLPPKFWSPLRDGDTDLKQNGDPYPDEYKGHYFINCKTAEDSPPNVVNTTRDEKGKFQSIAKNEVKSGDWGRIGINLAAYVKGTGGVGAYLTSVQLVRQGDPLSSHRSAEDDFGDFDDDDGSDGPDPLS